MHDTNRISVNPSAVCMGLFIFQCCIQLSWEGLVDIFVYLNDLDNTDFMNSKISFILQIKIAVIFKFLNERSSFLRILFCSKQFTDLATGINVTD